MGHFSLLSSTSTGWTRRCLEEAMPKGSAAGERYAEEQMRAVNR